MRKRKRDKIDRENRKRQHDPLRAGAYKTRRVPVDPDKLNMGNSYETAPDHYTDLQFECIDCGSQETWLAEQQKWWYEEVGAYFFRTATRCRACRKLERDRKTEARQVQRDGMKRKEES